jgi:hypothetical protein
MDSQSVTIVLRIPGTWSNPNELLKRLPAGYRFTPETLVLPDQTEIEWSALDADGQFAEIFRRSCREPASSEELAKVDSYIVNVCLSGPGGSREAAHTMMKAGAAIVRAGGAGVFIDNSGLAHGGENWLKMTEDGGPDALSFAFVSIIQGKTDVRTVGMHVLGLREIVMKRTDVEQGGFDIIEMIRYVSRGDKPVSDGDVIADQDGPRFQAFAEEVDRRLAGSPMHNPFGAFRLVSIKDIAEQN